MTIVRMPLAEAAELIGSGGITDAKTVIGLTLAREHLGDRCRGAGATVTSDPSPRAAPGGRVVPDPPDGREGPVAAHVVRLPA